MLAIGNYRNGRFPFLLHARMLLKEHNLVISTARKFKHS